MLKSKDSNDKYLAFNFLLNDERTLLNTWEYNELFWALYDDFFALVSYRQGDMLELYNKARRVRNLYKFGII